MMKLPIEKKSEKTRAKYLKVPSNVLLHVTDADGGKPIVLLPAGRIVTTEMNANTTILLIKI